MDSYLEPKLESDPESKLILLITKIMSSNNGWNGWISEEVILLSFTTILTIKSMDLDSLPKPESKLMSLVTQAIFVFNSMDFVSQPKPLLELISFISQNICQVNVKRIRTKFSILIDQTTSLKPQPELMSLIYQIFSLVISINSKWDKLISFCPQVQLRFEEERDFFEEIPLRSNSKWACFYIKWKQYSLTGEEATHFFCGNCCGKNHEGYMKAPVKVKHPLHPKHYIHLVLWEKQNYGKICYSCDKPLLDGPIFYYCSACNFALCTDCVEEQPLLSIDHPRWHEHKLALFPSQASFTCNLCALKHSSCPFYICPPCDFVVHQSCLSLPHVIRISRHPHRLSFTPSFDQGDWSCGVCRKMIDNDYGGYSCIKDGCLYTAHSKCATQENVWDGVDLHGVPEEIEEEIIEPFVRISDVIIQHFSHQDHHLRLDENTSRDYDEDKQCQACVTPIYFGNFYHCLQCDDFILHESCANLSRKIYHPLHPHLLTLVTDNRVVIDRKTSCSACPWLCTGFFYEYDKRECEFMVHVQCATISEPLVHASHMHPLFLTSKPGEQRTCSVCNDPRLTSRYSTRLFTNETFNCIEECDFALCFKCASLPEKVRYKHDKHMLTLSYGEEISTVTLWCEICEGKINPQKRFYKCDEYCCVTLHIECLIEKDLYMKPHLEFDMYGFQIKVLRNNHRMSRPICRRCGDGKRCPYRFSYKLGISVFCSLLEVDPIELE